MKRTCLNHIFSILVALVIFLCPMANLISYGEQEDPHLYANAAVLLDGDTNRILYEKNAHTLMPNASTTKIMTCILAIENGDPDMVCTVSGYAASMPETKAGFREGEQFYLKDLLYSLMLESHNDAAVVIAETLSGSVEAFAEQMNQKARDIGCEHTYFITPNGLDRTDSNGIHGASAHDLALIMNYCAKDQEFLRITQADSHRFSNVEGDRTFTVTNKNAFLNMQPGAISGKTGYTSQAGYCYVCAYEKNGRKYSIALLASGWPDHKTYKWKDTKALITYGNNNYERKNVGDPPATFSIPIPEGICCEKTRFSYVTRTEVISDGAVWPCLLSDRDQITTRLVCQNVQLPVCANEKAGVLEYYINGQYAGEQTLFYTETVIIQDLRWCFFYIMKEFLQITSF